MILALGRCQLSGSGFDGCLLAHGAQRSEMLIGQLCLGSCLNQCDRSLIQIFAREGALFEEIFAAVVELLLCVQRFVCRFGISFSFRQILGESSAGSCIVRSLGLIEGSFVVGECCRHVPVFQHC